MLTMTSGFHWPDAAPIPIAGQHNYIQFALHQPLGSIPGQTFLYNTLAIHIVSGILSKSTHMSALDYGMRKLFTPLGIARPRWPADLQGNSEGGNGLLLKTRDMAKFGYLYLNNGQWDGQQIIPPDWVKASTQKQVEGSYPADDGYGYLWWVTSARGHRAYFALGYGGQYIYVVPDLDLVVAITSNDYTEYFENKNIVPRFIVPACF